jgi:hypothetical protein
MSPPSTGATTVADLTFEFDVNRFDKEVTAVLMSGPVHDQMLDKGRALKNEIVARIHATAEVESEGGLADSVYGETFRNDEDEWNVVVKSELPRAVWFEEGTGIYGPSHTPIVPSFLKFMKFVPRGHTGVVYAHQVEGQEGKHPFKDGLTRFALKGGLDFD